MKRFLTCLGVSAIALITSEAAAWKSLDVGNPRWDKMPVTYRINEATIPSSIAAIGKARLDEGLAAWGVPSCTFWEVQNLGNTTTKYNANDGQNIFMWASGSWPQELGPVNSVIGVTMPVWDGSNVIYDADIVYNNVGFCWNDSGQNNCVDTLSIAVHEDGHFLGLDHSNVSGATMEPYYGGGNSIASIEQDDINGVCALYPMGVPGVSSATGPVQDCNTCANDVAKSQCSAQFNQCGASQDCINFYNCYSNCGSQQCADQCAAQYPTGAGIWGQFVDCVCATCTTECSAVCGGSSGSSSSSSVSSGNGASSSSSSGNPGAGGANGAGGSTGAWGEEETDPPPPKSDGSCSCSMEPAPIRFGAFLGLGALALGLMRRRSRAASKR